MNLQFFGGRGASVGGSVGGGGSAITSAAKEFGGEYASNPYVKKVAEIYVEASGKNNGYSYVMSVSPWKGGDKERIYLSISEKNRIGKLVNKRDYGFVDVKTGKYSAASKYNDLDRSTLYGFSGNAIR